LTTGIFDEPVRDLLAAFGMPEQQRERDRVSVAVNSLVRVGAVAVCGKQANKRGNGRSAHVYRVVVGYVEKPRAQLTKDRRDRILACLAGGEKTAREIADAEAADPHLVRAQLSTLKAQGRVAAASARLVNGRPEIVWRLTTETRSDTGNTCALSP
jgi:DNA-binding CsgD family transcriptional regulator